MIEMGNYLSSLLTSREGEEGWRRVQEWYERALDADDGMSEMERKVRSLCMCM